MEISEATRLELVNLLNGPGANDPKLTRLKSSPLRSWGRQLTDLSGVSHNFSD